MKGPRFWKKGSPTGPAISMSSGFSVTAGPYTAGAPCFMPIWSGSKKSMTRWSNFKRRKATFGSPQPFWKNWPKRVRDLRILEDKSAGERGRYRPLFDFPCSILRNFGSFYLLFQPGHPGFKTFAGPAGYLKNNHIPVQLGHPLPYFFNAAIHIREQVDLIDDKNPTFLKHQRIFQWLVVPFGDGQQHDFHILPHFEFSRADQIADIFHNEEIQGGKVQLIHRFPDHISIQMAGPIGVDLYGLDPFFSNPFGINTALDVPFNHPDVHPVF